MLVRLRSAWENKTLEKPWGWSSMRHQSLGREVASRLPCYVHLWWYYYIVMTFLELISYPILCLLWVISPIWYDYMIFLGEWLQSFGVSLSCDVSVIPWVVNNDPCQVHQHSSKTLVLPILAWTTGISCSKCVRWTTQISLKFNFSAAWHKRLGHTWFGLAVEKILNFFFWINKSANVREIKFQNAGNSTTKDGVLMTWHECWKSEIVHRRT